MRASWLAVLSFALFVGGGLAGSSSSARGGEDEDVTSDGADDDDGDPRVNCKGRGDRFCYKSWESKKCPEACKRCRKGRDMSNNMWSAIKSRDYDQVFARGDEICVAKCKKGRRRCGKRVSFKGDRYCLAIRCDANEAEGCHGGNDFERPRCEACDIMFPRSCKSDDDDDSSSSKAKDSEDDKSSSSGDDEDSSS